MTTNRQWTLKRRPGGMPSDEDFERIPAVFRALLDGSTTGKLMVSLEGS